MVGDGLLPVKRFVRDRRQIAEGRMAPLPVVPDGDVLKEREPSGGPGPPDLAMHQLNCERGEEALGHGIGIRRQLHSGPMQRTDFSA